MCAFTSFMELGAKCTYLQICIECRISGFKQQELIFLQSWPPEVQNESFGPFPVPPPLFSRPAA